MNKQYVILGANGQVGRAWGVLLGERAIPLTHTDCDLGAPHFLSALERVVGSAPIAAVINAAAYTQVDKAEGEGKAAAMAINGDASGALAAWCKARNIPLVHYSTDYVLSGIGTAPHTEKETPHPLNVYGKSKLAGEEAVKTSGGKYLIFRTSWVYDAQGKNFFNTMLRLFREKDSVNVVNDQVGAPTFAPHLAKASLAALTAALDAPVFPSGVYHLCAGGETSWHGFAEAIFALARSRAEGVRCQSINPIPSSAYPTPATRPLNSRLDCSKAKQVFGVALPDWESGLKDCFDEKHGHRNVPHSGIEAHSA